MLIADMGEPVCALTSHSGDDLCRRVCLILVGDDTLDLVVLDDDVLDHGAKLHLDPFL